LASAIDGGHEGSLLVVLHTAENVPRLLDALIQRHTSLTVRNPNHGDDIEAGCLYIAPPGRHMLVSARGRFVLSDGPKVNYFRPAADPLFESAAAYFGSRVVGVVLTGGGGDGTHGLRAIKRRGGLSVVQHPANVDAPEMPMNALNCDSPDHVLSLVEIAHLLSRLAQETEDATS
jgi:two-component system chemotaxis response regulator CheB